MPHLKRDSDWELVCPDLLVIPPSKIPNPSNKLKQKSNCKIRKRRNVRDLTEVQCFLFWHNLLHTANSKDAVTLGNFSSNLSRNFVAPFRGKLHATLPSVTSLRNAGKIRCSVAKIFAKSRTDFLFSFVTSRSSTFSFSLIRSDF